MNKRELGALGEQEAVGYLEQQGMTMLARNFRVGRIGEIDIIAKDPDGTVCFIEVKTRKSDSFGTPAEAVSRSKQQTIHNISQIFLQRRRQMDVPIRYDVMEVYMDSRNQVIRYEYLRNAF